MAGFTATAILKETEYDLRRDPKTVHSLHAPYSIYFRMAVTPNHANSGPRDLQAHRAGLASQEDAVVVAR